MRYSGKQANRDHLLEVARHCAGAFSKAPRITGCTRMSSEIITGEDLWPIIEMLGPLAKINSFVRWDYETFKSTYEAGNPPVLLLLAADLTRSQMGWDCGACGFATCKEFNAYAAKNAGRGQLWGGPSCNWKVLDFGIACDWAAAAAAQMKVDNRIQADSGAMAGMLGYLPGHSAFIGLPLGPAGDLVWYSREAMHGKFSEEEAMQNMFRCCPTHFGAFPGGGNPLVKNSQRWWETPRFNGAEASPQAMEAVAGTMAELAGIAGKYGPGIARAYQEEDPLTDPVKAGTDV